MIKVSRVDKDKLYVRRLYTKIPIVGHSIPVNTIKEKSQSFVPRTD